MFVGSPSERGHVYTPIGGRGGMAVAAAPSSHKEEAAGPDAIPLINPAINYDYQSGIAVLEIRDPKTGEVEVQYPSKKVVQEYIRQGAASNDAPHAVAAPDQAGGVPVAAMSAPVTASTGSVAPETRAPAPVATVPATHQTRQTA